MSVLGATDWFTSYLDQTGYSPPETNLVLGMYPIDFVREVASKFGAAFFASMKSTLSNRRLFHVNLAGRTLGSILPFSTPQFRPSILDMEVHVGKVEDDQAVSSWLIPPRGSVRIKSVGVVACSHGPSPSDIESFIMVSNGQNSSFFQEELSGALRRLSRAYTWYAVALRRDTLMLSGIVLKTARLRLQPTKYMVKVGYFRTVQRNFPNSQKVNRLVL
jgi:hypothetical protein